MKFKIDVYFINGKNLSLALEEAEMNKFIEAITRNKPYYDKTRKSSLCVPLYNVTHYNHYEYTEEMEKADIERAEAMKAKAKEEQPKKEEENK